MKTTRFKLGAMYLLILAGVSVFLSSCDDGPCDKDYKPTHTYYYLDSQDRKRLVYSGSEMLAFTDDENDTVYLTGQGRDSYFSTKANYRGNPACQNEYDTENNETIALEFKGDVWWKSLRYGIATEENSMTRLIIRFKDYLVNTGFPVIMSDEFNTETITINGTSHKCIKLVLYEQFNGDTAYMWHHTELGVIRVSAEGQTWTRLMN